MFVLAKSAIEPLDSVYISGQVVSPGKFPLTEGMHVLDLVLSAGGATRQAYLKEAEITRYHVVDGEKREVEHFQVNLAAALAGGESANVLLQPYDVLNIRTLSNWRNVERSIARLRAARALTPRRLARLRLSRLRQLVRSSGYFRQKAARVQGFARWFLARWAGSAARMFRAPLWALRAGLRDAR